MSKPILLAFCSPADRDRVIEASFGFGGFYFAGDTIDLSKERLALLAIGPEGGAALALWIERHGLDSVIGIGLVGVGAPWAKRSQGRCPKHYHLCGDEACEPTEHRLPLGPLEPLRAVAERARRDLSCGDWLKTDGSVEHALNHQCDAAVTRLSHAYEGISIAVCDVNHDVFQPWMGWDSEDVEPLAPLRFVVACTDDDGPCRECRGVGSWMIEHWDRPPQQGPCMMCKGAGKSLSSADVARELSGDTCVRLDVWQVTCGGVTISHYPTRAALTEHGLRSVIERLTQ